MENSEQFFSNYKPIQFDKLPWEEKATLMWSWYWRALIISIVTIWMSGFVGTILVMYLREFVGEIQTYALEITVYVVGSVIGFLGIHPLIKLLTHGKIGDFQIIILWKKSTQ